MAHSLVLRSDPLLLETFLNISKSSQSPNLSSKPHEIQGYNLPPFAEAPTMRPETDMVINKWVL